MTIITDKVRIKNGADYSFVCSKVPFAITCSSSLHHGSYNLIDLDLVTKMKIPLQKIKVCRMTYMGTSLRSVGQIDQTIHCVHNGVLQGTVHLAAKVVRKLFDSFIVDCIASSKTYERLAGSRPPDPRDENDSEDDDAEEQMEAARMKLQWSPSSSSCSSSDSSSSEDGYAPITKEWLFKASFAAEIAQMDSPEVLLHIENEISNYDKAEDLDKDNTSSSTDNDTAKTEEDEDTYYHHDAQGMENDCHDA